MEDRRTGILVFLWLLLAPGVASAWWNDDWDFRKQINLDMAATGAGVQGSPADVPLLVRLHAGNFSYFNDVLADGGDIRFVASDDVTPLRYHVERFDPVNQIAFVWVRMPRLTGGTSTDYIYMYYGNPDVSSAGDAGGTYDTNQVLVYHFSEQNGIPRDATAYRNDPEETSVPLNSASLIGGGARFDGATQIVAPDSPSLRLLPDQGVTLSAWVRFDEPQAGAYVVAVEDDLGNALALGVDGYAAFVRLAAGEGEPLTITSAELQPSEWHHLALVAGSGSLALLVDGVQAASSPAELPNIVGRVRVGRSLSGANGFVGEMDELQVANTARSDDWLKAFGSSQAMFSTMVTYGDDAQNDTGGGDSYFAITMRNVTVDGWVVVVILVIMAVISWVVMFGKAVLLSRVERQNRRFIDQYRELGVSDPLSLAREMKRDAASGAHALTFNPSTLYPLYMAGVQEVAHRLKARSPAVGAQSSGFSAETIGAIRATVDAALVRQRQRLNRQMVLLTIAISGGPFLGLLGTVVGVMITFAAIAASGDVNVNAIAPGIAAALVATVAGLAVAIPALFGYNWLGSRIKDIDAETHVFADEFVNRLAEAYA